jgi:hypothetical protein
VKKSMAVKGIKDTEKAAVGAIRTAIQTWLAPELMSIGEPLTHVEARLDGLAQRVASLEQRMDEDFKSMRSEVGARFDALRGESIAHFDAVRWSSAASIPSLISASAWPPLKRSSPNRVNPAVSGD